MPLVKEKNKSGVIMKVIKFAFLFLIPFAMIAQTAEQKSIAVTVYNQNLGVIKDIRSLNLDQGIQEIKITDVAKSIDPTSVHISFDGNVLEQNYQYDLVNLSKILSKYVDRQIQLIDDKGNLIEGTLLSAQGGQIVLKKLDGGLLLLPSTEKYRLSVESLPEGLITKPTLIWQVESQQKGKQDIQIEYQTGGMNWHAEYVALLNEADTKMSLNSWVSVENNSGTTFKNAKLKLIAGDVRRVNDRYRENIEPRATADQAVMTKTAVTEKAFFEYHLYDIERPTTLSNNETKQISLFQAQNVDITKRYLYQSAGYNTENAKASVIVEFKNKESNGLGIPLPKGKVRLYKSDGESVEFIGEDLIDHTPKNDELKLVIGEAFDIRISETQTNRKKLSEKAFEESYEIKILNSKDEDITVDISKYLYGDWKILNASAEYKKKSSNNIVFNVPVKAETETVLKFNYRYSY